MASRLPKEYGRSFEWATGSLGRSGLIAANSKQCVCDAEAEGEAEDEAEWEAACDLMSACSAATLTDGSRKSQSDASSEKSVPGLASGRSSFNAETACMQHLF